jgi:N-acetylglucosamine-6-sulfatase
VFAMFAMRGMSRAEFFALVSLTGFVGFAAKRPVFGLQKRRKKVTKPNILLIVSDDQPYHTVRQMPKLRERFGERGVRFDKAYCSVPLCGPNRVSLLSGMYAHNHGATSNRGTEGIYRASGLDAKSIGVRLQEAGYATGYFGKYINFYEPPYVPPGWERWVVYTGGQHDLETFTTFNGSETTTHQRAEVNETDWMAERVERFIRNRSAEARPWFAVFAPFAPHAPYTPAPRHEHDFDSQAPYDVPSTNEQDLSDKPARMRDLPRVGWQERQDAYEGKLEELQEIDDAVERLVGAIWETGGWPATVAFYTTDNGYMLGEHRLMAKGTPYEESVRVPLLARGAGVDSGTARRALVSTVDLTATIATLAGADVSGYDGRSLVGLLGPEADASTWRKRLLVEHPEGGWSMLRTPTHAYAEHAGDPEGSPGERELYDMEADPHQLESLHDDPAHADKRVELAAHLAALRDCAGDSCRIAEGP